MEQNEEQKKMKKAERLAKRREQKWRCLPQDTEKHYSENRKTVYLFITNGRGDRLLEILKPNEGTL
jgi:hypothetical protein